MTPSEIAFKHTRSGKNIKHVTTRYKAAFIELAAQFNAIQSILAHVVDDGRGREFYPLNLDGSPNEMFVKAVAFTPPTPPISR